MTPDEIRTMSIKRAILICGHYPPIIGRLRPYYKNSIFNGYSRIPAPLIENSELPGSVAILPISTPDRKMDE
jgi:type IV secretory pathway TraG/TraD family ATPase VirD4